MTPKGTVIVVGGPTASGKTNAAIELAKHFGTEVISADSRQFYTDMRIGTARPTEAELGGVKHHFLGHLNSEETWSAGTFARTAETVLQELLSRTDRAILVGGSGLYIDALIKGLDPLPLGDHKIREQLQKRFKADGLDPLLSDLKKRDPATWTTIDRANPHRVLRALEVCLVSGRPFSEQRTTPEDRTDLRIVRIAMDMPREKLYARIDQRVDAMVEAGLVQEVHSLIPYKEINALRTVGYRELFEHFTGNSTLDEAIALIKQHTRNYAKRQMTWLRRDKTWNWVEPDNVDRMRSLIDR